MPLKTQKRHTYELNQGQNNPQSTQKSKSKLINMDQGEVLFFNIKIIKTLLLTARKYDMHNS